MTSDATPPPSDAAARYEARLAEIRTLERMAHKGPWLWIPIGTDLNGYVYADVVAGDLENGIEIGHFALGSDAELIAAARNLLPDLLEERDRLARVEAEAVANAKSAARAAWVDCSVRRKPEAFESWWRRYVGVEDSDAS